MKVTFTAKAKHKRGYGKPLQRTLIVLKTLMESRYGVHVGRMSAELACSERTVQRSIATLEDAGFPLYFEKTEGGMGNAGRWKMSMEGQ